MYSTYNEGVVSSLEQRGWRRLTTTIIHSPRKTELQNCYMSTKTKNYLKKKKSKMGW
jgi:hypothetical protein